MKVSGLQNIDGFTVASHAPVDGSAFSVEDLISVKEPNFRGVDVFISRGWPKDFYYFLDDDELQTVREGPGLSVGSDVIANAVEVLSPRYHFTSHQDFFYQRSPYRNTDSPVITRFISLAQVSERKEKDKKWVHALSLVPMAYTPLSSPQDSEPLGTTDSPFVKIGLKSFGKRPISLSSGGSVSNSSKVRRVEDTTHAGGGKFFFGSMGVPMESSAPRQTANLVPPSSSARTLFVANLPKNRFQDHDLLGLFMGAVRFHRPEGKQYGFVDFESHDKARAVVAAGQAQSFVFYGRQLTIGWSSSDRDRNHSSAVSDTQNAVPLAHNFSPDNTSLFIGGVPASHFAESDLLSIFKGAVSCYHPEGKNYAFLEVESHDMANELIKQALVAPSAFTFKGSQLAVSWGKRKGDGSGLVSSGTSRSASKPNMSHPSNTLFVGGLPGDMQAEIAEQKLRNQIKDIVSIRIPEGRNFAFVELACEADAIKVVEGLTDMPLSIAGKELSVGYAKGKSAANSSHAGECWFCLASESVKTHLIASVGDNCYVALPRGGLTPHHALIIPIACVPSRVHMSIAAKEDLRKYQDGIQAMYQQKQNSVSLRFERSIRTKGKDHMQVQMVPVPSHRVSQSFPLFIETATKYDLKFKEISESDGAIDEVVLNMDGGPYQEYFFIELPVNAEGGYKRFVYVHADQVQSPSPSTDFLLYANANKITC